MQPPRDSHNAAFGRHLKTGRSTILGARLELTAMRADGSEFPVEVAITRSNLSENPFFTGILTFEDAGNGQTRYTARALHWTKENREAHEKMGFHQGWGVAADQMTALARTL